MLVKENIKGKTYNKLIDYIFENCDIISMRKYCDQQHEKNNRIGNIILSDLQYSLEDIVKNYSEDFLKKIYINFKDNDLIFDENYKKDLLTYTEDNKKDDIYNCIIRMYYDKVIENLIDTCQDELISKKDCIIDEGFLEKPLHHSIIYYFNLSEKIKDILCGKNSLYSWNYPNSIEDLCFFKEGYCWLDSVAHEELCFIYCKDEEEYEYLKSIGIEFVEDKFVPVSRNELYYVDYKQKD